MSVFKTFLQFQRIPGPFLLREQWACPCHCLTPPPQLATSSKTVVPAPFVNQPVLGMFDGALYRAIVTEVGPFPEGNHGRYFKMITK